jgi:hypothetical protein
MKPLQIALAARDVVKSITAKEPEVVSRCERQDPNWKVMVEVIETKARIDDNDLLASYEVEIDPFGELVGYERVRRYKRAQGVLTA